MLLLLVLPASSARSQTQSVPTDVVAWLRKQAQMTYLHTLIPHNEEYVAALLSNGSVVYVLVSDRGGKFSLPPGIMLLLHTHPFGASLLPSDVDMATAKKIAAPNCVVTAREVWCAMPNGKIARGVAARQGSSLATPRTLPEKSGLTAIHLQSNFWSYMSFTSISVPSGAL